MGLMKLIGLRRLLPRSIRARFRNQWNDLLSLEQHFRERRFYRGFIQPGDLVFDVGANRGSKSGAFLSLGANVVAIEPNPICVEYMRKRYLREINRKQLRVKEAAVTSDSGQISLLVFDDDAEMCSGSEEFLKYAEQVGYTGARQVTAEATTLDELVREFGLPTYIKIDVEGMDADVIRGLSKRPRFLSFEYNTADPLWKITKDCFDQVNRLGFSEANYTRTVDPRLQLGSWISLNDALSNFARLKERGDHWGDVIVR